MAKKKSFTKMALGISAAVVAGKVVYDKYKVVKEQFEEEERQSITDEVRKYNSVAGKRAVEVQDEVFERCDMKAVGSSFVLDLSLAVFEKDVYINFSSICSNVKFILPEGVNVACDIEKVVSKVDNQVENVTEDGIHTIYVIGKATASNIEIIPMNFYCEYEDFEDMDEDEFPESEHTEDDKELIEQN